MYGGDRARKINLVEYGFRLPAAMDNRPLKFDEFEEMAKQVIYVSATPADYELMKSEGIVVEQVIRPTGTLGPHHPGTSQPQPDRRPDGRDTAAHREERAYPRHHPSPNEWLKN